MFVKQLKILIKFNQFLDMNYNTVYRDLPYKFKVKWIRDLKTRMYREGLLGNSMVN